MGGFSSGLACGIGCGMAIGIGSGAGSGKAAVYKQLRRLIKDGRIHVTDNMGNAVTEDALISLLSQTRKK